MASTSAAAFYEHILGSIAPYPFFSIPVILGTIGGVGILVGTEGLLWVKLKSDPEPGRSPCSALTTRCWLFYFFPPRLDYCCSCCATRERWEFYWRCTWV